MSSFKLIKGELDKIFIRPAIFVMTVFFVIAMVLSALAFEPTPRQDNRVSMEANSVTQVYNAFYSETGNNMFKVNFDNLLENSGNKILKFYVNSDSANFYNKNQILDQCNNLQNVYNTYRSAILNHDIQQSTSVLEVSKENVKIEINKLKAMFDKINNEYPTILLTKNTYNELISNISYLDQTISSVGDIHSYEYHNAIKESVDENGWITNIYNKISSNMKDIVIKASTLTNLQKLYNAAKIEKLPKIETELSDFHNKIQSESSASNTNQTNIQTAKDIISKYNLVVNEAVDIIYCTLLMDICDKLSTNSVASYYGNAFKSFDYYEYNERISRNTYLFENDLYEFNYANVFQAGFNSNYETNAFDFMYYAMELLSILIILFCVILGADMIAGEQSNGTLKFLAIRPYKRSKILNSKIISTILFGLIFAIIGLISSFIIGAFIYGIDNTLIITTFNASDTFVVEPIILILIYLATLMLRIIFYTILAVFLSTLFKSNIASIVISFIIYLLVAIFSPVLKSTIIYQYLPFVNVDLFKYFGGEFQNNEANANIFGLDFTPPIVGDMSFFFSLINIAVFSILIFVITHIIFKKRDIT